MHSIGDFKRSTNVRSRCPSQQSLEQHLAHCSRCRSEFEQLAGETAFWKQASETLKRAASETASESGLPPSFNSSVFMQLDASANAPTIESVLHGDTDDVARQRLEASALLDPPHHPEMLGRIDGFNIEQMIGRGGMGVVYKLSLIHI